MANWWENDPVAQDETQNAPTTGDNWWENDPTIDQQDAPVVQSPDGGLQDDLNRMRESGELDRTPTLDQEDTGVLRSQEDLYSGVKNDPKYAPLNDYEDDLSYRAGVNVEVGGATYSLGQGLNPFGDNFGNFRMPPELEQLKKDRSAQAEKVYQSTGSTDTVAGIIPVRTQEKVENNPSFDPMKPEGPDNQAMVSTRYLVDPPEQKAINRMAYQVLQNVVGGVGDAVVDQKFITEGRVGQSLPETVPGGDGEKFVDDMATFALGGMAVTKGTKMAVGGVGALAGKAATTISPEATAAIKSAYETTLKTTGSAVKAKLAANAVTRNTLIGLGLTMRTGAMGAADLVVAPNDTQGLISPESIQKTFGVSPERAKDFSVALDSPIIGGTLGTFGKMYSTLRDKLVVPTFGGLRNVNLGGVAIGSALPMAEKSAGLKMITHIDPNIAGLSPEDAAFKIKVLSDSIQRNATKNLQIGSVGKEIPLDTPTAYNEVAEDYFRIAYADRKDQMGPEAFQQWVKDQAQNTSTSLFEIRTALTTNDTAAKGSTRIMDLLDESTDNVAGGSLAKAQGRTTELATDIQNQRFRTADEMTNNARLEADTAKEAVERGVQNDPEFKLFIDEANAELGSKKGVYDLTTKMGEKTYQALKTLKTETDDAYQAIANTGAEGDPVSILETIKKYSDVTPGQKPKVDSEEALMRERLGLPLEGATEDTVKITDPFLRKVANEVEADPSFGNIYNNIRNQVNEQIKRAQNAGDSNKLDALYDLRDNINNDQLDFVAQQGDENVQTLVNNAKEKYINYKSTFGEPENKMLQKAGENRLRGEKFSPGMTAEGQGKTNWDVTFGNKIQELDGINGKPLRDSLSRAAKAGGQDIDGDLANYYASKAITNLSNSVSAGNKQGVGELRRNIGGIIEGLQGVNSPMVEKFRKLEANLQTLENTALNKADAYDNIKKQADDLRKEAQQSVLAKFMDKGGTIEPSEVGREMKTMFRGNKSVTRIKELMKEADAMGEQGVAIKDALKGSYMDYVKERIGSRSALGIGEAGANGEVRTGYRISETQAEKLFDEGGNDLSNMKVIFADQPEIVDTLEELRKTYTNLSKKTPRQSGNPLGPVERSEDPEQAMNSLITFTLGVLNPMASKARRLTGPMSVQSLDQVRQARAGLLNAMMEDPNKFAEVATKVRKGIESDEINKYLRGYLTRGAARSAIDKTTRATRGDDKENLRSEMNKLK